MSPVQVVWLKKSLRLADHPCLSRAAKRGPVLPIYILEREYWRLPDTSYRHYLFLKGCLEEMAKMLEEKGARLAIGQHDVSAEPKSLLQ
ncbi:MAG: deoxyribodipyrimidine photo-lyase, partial [Cyanobacteria bacterium J06649_4]